MKEERPKMRTTTTTGTKKIVARKSLPTTFFGQASEKKRATMATAINRTRGYRFRTRFQECPHRLNIYLGLPHTRRV
jgi:hypothetical protein